MLKVFCDGGSRNNPGHAAFGFVVKENGQVIKEAGGYIGIATNNFAEYTALIEALKWLKDNFAGNKLEVFMDSQLAVSQLSGIFKVKNATIRELIFKVRELESQFRTVSYNHIRRELNTEADRLVNEVLDAQLGFRL
jgi:ribonuclease HI